MSLPSVSYPIFNLKIPSTKKIVKARPFLVKEFKILVQTIELNDKNSVINVIIDIVSNCLFNTVDIKELPMYDIDYLFLNIRARSSGEMIPIEYICKNKIGDSVCNTNIKLELNLNELTVKFPNDYEAMSNIKITDKQFIKLKAPTFLKYDYFKDNLQKNDFSVPIYCIEHIILDDKILIPEKDFNENELKEYCDNLPAFVIKQINNFLKNLPYACLETQLKCPKCNKTETIELKDIDDFFV